MHGSLLFICQNMLIIYLRSLITILGRYTLHTLCFQKHKNNISHITLQNVFTFHVKLTHVIFPDIGYIFNPCMGPGHNFCLSELRQCYISHLAKNLCFNVSCHLFDEKITLMKVKRDLVNQQTDGYQNITTCVIS